MIGVKEFLQRISAARPGEALPSLAPGELDRYAGGDPPPLPFVDVQSPFYETPQFPDTLPYFDIHPFLEQMPFIDNPPIPTS
jgi:hypothetical protein